MHTINVYYNKCAHTSRVLTGFHMLETNNRIKLKMIENTDKIYPLEVDMLNFLFSTKIKKAREVSERINEIIDNETNPIIFEGLRNIEKGTMNL